MKVQLSFLIMTDRPSDQPTDQSTNHQTDMRVHWHKRPGAIDDQPSYFLVGLIYVRSNGSTYTCMDKHTDEQTK